MYSKFTYTPSPYFYQSELNQYVEIGNEIYQEHSSEMRKCLSEYITEDGTINGSELKEDWFSVSNKDIFISHSHQDISKVKAFAGWLYDNFELEAFIDSCSWGYCDVLLNKIDKAHCYDPKKKTYDYNLRNYTTSHVHMMLSTALTEMLDRSECVIFFNTPNSIIMPQELKKINAGKAHETLSPWIFHELSITRLLRTHEPDREKLEHFAYPPEKRVQIKHEIGEALKDMIELKDSHLVSWKKTWKERKVKIKDEALPALYEIVAKK